MAKFLTTTHISAELEDLIKSAREYIVLISPYMKVNQRLQGFIKAAAQRGIRFTLIYGKREMNPEEQEWINQINAQTVVFVQDLHAKCCLSESTAIITSMNLYEFSQQNNDEMGVLVSRKETRELYQEIYDEAIRLRDAGTTQRGTKSTTPPLVPAQGPTTSGYCIRCHTPISLNPDKPLCNKCYQSWSQYQNENYREEYCHHCGKENDTSMAKPLCLPCYRLAN